MPMVVDNALRRLPAVAERYEQPELRLLVSLCRELQRATGDGPFYLAVRTGAKIVGKDAATVSTWSSTESWRSS